MEEEGGGGGTDDDDDDDDDDAELARLSGWPAGAGRLNLLTWLFLRQHGGELLPKRARPHFGAPRQATRPHDQSVTLSVLTAMLSRMSSIDTIWR